MNFIAEIIDVAWRFRSVFFEGMLGTLQLASITVFFGTLLGALVALLRMSRSKILSTVAKLYIDIIRGTPMLVQLYIFYMFVPQMIPALKALALPEYFYIVLSLVVNSAAYVSEIIRSGIQAVDKGQTEAARSLGMSASHCMTRIILPQAIKNILPALGNEFIMMVKETSLASTFYVNELMRTKIILQSTYFITWQSLFVIAIIYYVLTTILSKLVSLLERRLAVGD